MIEKRCAIYTRKSHEEGLEQEYNSLDAQRDACEAFIKSQAHEGWKPVRKQYDDGGFSGGNLNRPALQELLGDVQDGKVDVIVVYKIDRLTRSLMDFSNVVQVLDDAEASFVSVTQHFNTTSSMGRLTLNVLLSFAQFEREVTGERIRDKIAASRKKGMWMGGARPLGYDNENKKLVINRSEADIVRRIFDRYLILGTAADVALELGREGIRNKEWVGPDGNTRGGKPFRPQGIYKILQNPLYAGKMQYRDEVFEGEHESIIPQSVWDAVQEQIASNRVNRGRTKKTKSNRLLEGILYDAEGQPMTPTYSTKKGNRRYPYYTSRSIVGRKKAKDSKAMRIPAHAIDDLVVDRVATVTSNEDVEHDQIRQCVSRVTVHVDMVEIEFNRDKSGVDLFKAESRGDEVVVSRSKGLLRIRAKLQTRKSKVSFITPAGFEAINLGKPDAVLVRNVVTAWKWREMLDSKQYESIPELSRREKVSEGYVRRILPLSFLAPDIVDSILNGNQPPSADLKQLVSTELPLSWKAQRALLGYTA